MAKDYGAFSPEDVETLAAAFEAALNSLVDRTGSRLWGAQQVREMSNSISPVLAQSGHGEMSSICPLSGGKADISQRLPDNLRFYEYTS
jgi:hypothetical protein